MSALDVDALVARRAPRLGLVMAVLAAAVAVMTVAVAPLLDLQRVPLAHAMVGAVLVGGLVGMYMRRRCRLYDAQKSRVRRWAPLLMAWLLAAAVVGFGCGFVANMHWLSRYPLRQILEWAFTGVPVGLASGVLAFPLCMWLVIRAQRATRARLGSLVADSDRRSIIAALMCGLSLLSLLVWWAFAPDLGGLGHLGFGSGTTALMLVLYISVVAPLAMVALYMHARRDCDELERVAARIESLDELAQEVDRDADERGALPLLDLGLGHELYGALPAASSYRSGASPVAEVAGFVESARVELMRARHITALQLGFTACALLINGLLLIH